ncbi:hypothetical protein M9434_000638 [Picochlorum sp. BPE23]|nr:hypothetical protein M9434_000638 [Picochlorum sp. BPE23]
MVGVTSVETENADQALKPISLVPGPDTSERATENLPTNNTFCSQGPMQENVMGIQCTGYFPSWFYNATTDSCEEYEYGGCGGTMNLFSTEKACTTSADKFCRRDEDGDEDEDADPLRVVVVDDVQESVDGASGAHSVTAFSGLVFVIGALTYMNV